MKKIFLGGTCNNSKWREEIKPLLNIEYFDPIVPDWDEESYQRELFERETSNYVLYTITPKLTGVYSIAEIIEDSNKRPEKTIFVVLSEDEGTKFDKFQLDSLNAVKKMVIKNGATVFDDLASVAEFVNK